MWAFDDAVRDKILKGSRLLQQGNETEFLAFQQKWWPTSGILWGKRKPFCFLRRSGC